MSNNPLPYKFFRQSRNVEWGGRPSGNSRTACTAKKNDMFGVKCQWWLGRIAIFVIGPVVWAAMLLCGYRISGLRQFRRRVRSLLDEHPGPWLVCPNHLTLIDSVLLIYAMAPLLRYWRHFRLLPWNVPEQTNFQRNFFSTLLCYLGKCVPINRRGNREQLKKTLAKCVDVLGMGETLMIFPEGTRSRTGRVDFQNVTYGVGRLLQYVPECRVMCIYLRGDRQETYGRAPRFGEHLYAAVREVKLLSPVSGLRAQRAVSLRILAELAEMESFYFALRGE